MYSVCLSICPESSARLSVCPSICPSVCLSVYCSVSVLYVWFGAKCRKLKFSSSSKQTLGPTCGQPWPAICPDPAAAAAAMAGRPLRQSSQPRSRLCLCAARCETDIQKPKCFYCISALTYGPILPGIITYIFIHTNTYTYMHTYYMWHFVCASVCVCMQVSI